MPEGHLIHWFARRHRESLAGRTLEVTSPQGRFATEARRLDGKVLEGVDAYGKHLLYEWEGGDVVHVHLGMQGKFLPLATGAPPLRQARLRLAVPEDGGVDLVAPSACELLDDREREALLARLGPDPLRPDADGGRALAAIAATARPVGAVLLDQAVVAGIGNVLRAEGLFAARIHPDRPASSLSMGELERLWSALVEIMRAGAEEGRVITRRPEGVREVSEAEGRYVYKQERCRSCGAPVETWELAGRTAYACPREQPRTA